MSPAGRLRSVAVVGGSLAAATAASALRTAGFDGRITLISEELHAPYARPPLSKGILTGTDHPDSAALHLADGIELRLGARAGGLRLAERRVTLSDGGWVTYDGLVIATGARARALCHGPGELRLRSVDDALVLRASLLASHEVIVVGAGPLGMEIASACRELGRAVTVIDPCPPMRRQVGGFLADLLVEAARDAGVVFLRPAGPVLVEEAAVVVGGVRREADTVVTAAGERPNTEWLADSGLTLDGGLCVDERLIAAPGVVAAGDVVSRPGGHRTPLWSSALDQATAAAAALLDPGAAPVYRPRPYFWTEQFGLAVKVCGLVPAAGVPVVVEGSRDERSMILQWYRDGRPVAAATVNRRMPLPKLRRLAV
ncbi:NAD(P)/FAD-dependent oxidoreductase [Streptomyces sp. NPDC127117]|uniref:NAD(P)/FAD-dependent oxidoreductase n=1 Tax=Streptomyces sp. NPDC127117 TaxID=3345368 RepID=UPI00363B12B8